MNDPTQLATDVHTKRILLVEDDANYYSDLIRWLTRRGYHVTHVTTAREALAVARTEYFHVAIIDIMLLPSEGAQPNEDGLDIVLKELTQAYQPQPDGTKTLYTIVFTSVAQMHNALKALDYKVDAFIEKKGDYDLKLFEKLDELFSSHSAPNFDLAYVGDTHAVIPRLAEQLVEAETSLRHVPVEDMATQIYDLLGKLYKNASEIYVAPLKPGLTGAALLRIQPTLEDGTAGAYRVAKIGRRDKIEYESQNHGDYVADYLQASAVTHVAAQFSRDIGAISYTFAQNEQGQPLREFDDIYKSLRYPTETIIASLRHLIRITCNTWYTASRVQGNQSIIQIYYRALRLDQEHLLRRVRRYLPDFDIQAPQVKFGEIEHSFLNPIHWLIHTPENDPEVVMNPTISITHGDLTGRNIMVDARIVSVEGGQHSGHYPFWLIDFYRTQRSHVLRDLLILESDIKFRLMPLLSLYEFLQFEMALLGHRETDQPPRFEPEVQRAYDIITALRQIADEMRWVQLPRERRREHLLSLLMVTLNVIRLKHIQTERKEQALLSASLLVTALQEINENTVRWPNMGRIQEMREQQDHTRRLREEATLEHRRLLRYIHDGRVILYIGRQIPARLDDWPNLHRLANWLSVEMDMTLDDNDSPLHICALYEERAGRNALLNAYLDHFGTAPDTPYYEHITELPWQAIFTAEQHTFTEDAYRRSHQSPHIVVDVSQLLDSSHDQISIYKLFGSFDPAYRRQGPAKLPLTSVDYELPETEERVSQLRQHLFQQLHKGSLLLMLFPSEETLTNIRRWIRTEAPSAPQIWVAGGDIDEATRLKNQRVSGIHHLNDCSEELIQRLVLLQHQERAQR